MGRDREWGLGPYVGVIGMGTDCSNVFLVSLHQSSIPCLVLFGPALLCGWNNQLLLVLQLGMAGFGFFFLRQGGKITLWFL